MNKKIISAGIMIALIAIVGVTIKVRADYVASPQPDLGGAIPTNEQAVQLASGQTVVSKSVRLGAATGPEINSPYIKVGGITEWYQTASFRNATSTLCSFASPFATSTNSASTSPVFLSVRITTPATTSLEIDAGTSTNGFSTSSKNFISNFLPGANATNTASFWMPTTVGMFQGNNEYIVVAAAQVGTQSLLAGTCQLEATQY